MTDPNRPGDPSPAEALAAVRDAQARVTRRISEADTLRYDLIYAGIVGVMVASPGLPDPFNTVLIVFCTVALVLLMRGWANRTGLWVTGVTPPRARWVAVGLGGLLMLFMLGGLMLTKTHGMAWVTPILGLVAAGLAFGASRLWWRVYRKESERRS